MKTLYFEAAGSPHADYNGINCRIRTAFINDFGSAIYLEISGWQGAKDKKAMAHIWHCVETVKVRKFEFKTNRSDNGENDVRGLKSDFEYTPENIRKFVNEQLKCSFDNIVVLDNLAGYRVHGKNGRYNLMEDFEYNEELTKRRIAKVAEISENYKNAFNMKYDNTSYYIEDGELVVRINASDAAMKKAGILERKYIVEM